MNIYNKLSLSVNYDSMQTEEFVENWKIPVSGLVAIVWDYICIFVCPQGISDVNLLWLDTLKIINSSSKQEYVH